MPYKFNPFIGNLDVVNSYTSGDFDHGGLTGLADDDHTQYALLAGRSGGQTLIGGTASGNDLILTSTSHSTKGQVQLGTGTIAKIVADEENNTLYVGSGSAVHAVRFAPIFNNDVSGTRGVILVPDVESNVTGLGGVGITPTLRPGANLGVSYGAIALVRVDQALDTSSSFNITNLYAYYNRIDLQATYSGTIANATNFNVANAQETGGSITNLVGVNIEDLTVGTVNRGMVSAVSSGTDKHNLYISGTAANYFAGNLGIGEATPLSKLHITGASGWIIQDEQDTNPTTTELDADDSVAIYNKADKFVIAYNNGGTMTYISIPLDGSTTTWTHNTTAP